MRNLQRRSGPAAPSPPPRPPARSSNGLRLPMLRNATPPSPSPPPPPAPAVKSSCLTTAAPAELPPACDCCLFGDGSLASPSPIKSPAQKKFQSTEEPRPPHPRRNSNPPRRPARIGTQSRSFQLRAEELTDKSPDNSNSPNPRARDSPKSRLTQNRKRSDTGEEKPEAEF
ncbi:hypothetical protein NL676_009566 [Syzygium grande]|nr:hypothetical protein NL676_009566 [Syzygium grande]